MPNNLIISLFFILASKEDTVTSHPRTNVDLFVLLYVLSKSELGRHVLTASCCH